MIKTISATQAQQQLGRYLDDISDNKKQFIIQRNGKPIGALISLDDLEDVLEISNEVIQKEIEYTDKEVKDRDYITVDKL